MLFSQWYKGSEQCWSTQRRFEAADQPLVVQVAELEDSTMLKTQEAMSAQEEIEVVAGAGVWVAGV